MEVNACQPKIMSGRYVVTAVLRFGAQNFISACCFDERRTPAFPINAIACDAGQVSIGHTKTHQSRKQYGRVKVVVSVRHISLTTRAVRVTRKAPQDESCVGSSVASRDTQDMVYRRHSSGVGDMVELTFRRDFAKRSSRQDQVALHHQTGPSAVNRSGRTKHVSGGRFRHTDGRPM